MDSGYRDGTGKELTDVSYWEGQIIGLGDPRAITTKTVTMASVVVHWIKPLPYASVIYENRLKSQQLYFRSSSLLMYLGKLMMAQLETLWWNFWLLVLA